MLGCPEGHAFKDRRRPPGAPAAARELADLYLVTVAQVASTDQLLPDWNGWVFMIR